MIEQPSAASSPPKRRAGILKWFAPAPAIPVTLIKPDEIEEAYRRWRRRVLLATIVGYALFYFVRKNLSVAMPVMEKDLGISKSDLGLFLTLHGLLYGVARFANGFLADRSNARTFMVVGLVASALMNVFFGLSSAVVTLGLIWMLNGWVQGMGFPPISRLMTHWFPPHQLATKQSIWNTSHSIGAGLVVILCGYLVAPRGEVIAANWRLCFFVPAALALLGAVFLWLTLPDTPPSVGLPEVKGTEHTAVGTQTGDDFKAFLMENVFRNKYIWLVALANFFVYVVRYAVLDWGPTLLSEAKDVKLAHAAWMVTAFEISGVVGMLLCGWLTDRVFGGRGARACLFYMALAGISLLIFWKLPAHSKALSLASLCCAGFFIYGPQALIGIIVANLATKRAAATAAGFTGIFGYASTLLSGWGLGKLVELHGWDAGFAGLLGAAAIGTLLFAAAWGAKAHGYVESPKV
jgi:OPA family glycerol-3-phosphate transporter-like MFS transporter/OPA family sugar phosphate sensor protein UhpC-like MFS transporter